MSKEKKGKMLKQNTEIERSERTRTNRGGSLRGTWGLMQMSQASPEMFPQLAWSFFSYLLSVDRTETFAMRAQ